MREATLGVDTSKWRMYSNIIVPFCSGSWMTCDVSQLRSMQYFERRREALADLWNVLSHPRHVVNGELE